MYIYGELDATQWSRSRSMTGYKLGRRQRLRLTVVAQLVLASLGVFWLFNFFSRYPSHAQEHQEQPQPTVGKVMMIYGNHSIYDRAIATHQEHSRRLGYPLHVLRREILDGVWNKYAILLQVLLQELAKPPEQRLEWLYWFDSDTVLMNPNMKLETFLPPPHATDIHILLTKDWNGMNNGVFPIRVHAWSVQLISAAIAYPVVNPDVELFWPDQSALDNLFNENIYFSKSVVYCPLRWFNAYMRSPDGESLNPGSPAHLQVHPGDLLVHFPGTARENLETTLGPYIAIAEEHRPQWEVPVEETGYIKETADFWRTHARQTS
ncbi:uncharacterized protein BJX67DRAFT_356565 [Aspergillus lucknowensis]|uniref:Galactosyl transferase GMA12/MNN10 family protein n=1 Tax=Aspergillus lucknowensis TaxID=176173 RepID=A0ABR4LNS4_9EURO